MRSLVKILIVGMVCARAYTQEAPDGVELRSRFLGVLPIGISSFGATEFDDGIFVSGGHSGRAHHYQRNHQSQIFFRFSPDHPALIEILPDGRAAQGHALITVGDQIVEIGGLRVDNLEPPLPDLHSESRARLFDPSRRRWSDLPSLPAPRSSFDSAAIGKTIYVAGGWSLSGSPENSSWRSEVLALDLGAPSPAWRQVLSLEQPRRAAALVPFKDLLLLLGGLGQDGRPQRDVISLNPLTGEQSLFATLPSDGFGAAACVLEGRLCVSLRSGAVVVFNEKTHTFETEGRLIFSRLFHRMIPDKKGRLIVLGGSDAGGPVRAVECLQWNDRRAGSLDLLRVPFPGKSKIRAAAYLDGHRLSLFGGNRHRERQRHAPEDFLDEGFCLDLRTLTWTRSAALPFPCQSASTVIRRTGSTSSYLLLGGFGSRNGQAMTLNQVCEYDPALDRWDVSENLLPGSVSQAPAIIKDEAVRVLGGLRHETQHGIRMETLASVMSRSSEQGAMPPLPKGRRAHAVAEVNGLLYFVGGLGDGFRPVSSFDVYDPKAANYRELSAPKASRFGASLIPLHGRLYLLGGFVAGSGDEPVEATSIETYDPVQDRWSDSGFSLPTTSAHAYCFPWQDRILAISTDDDGSASLHIFRPPHPE